MNTRAPDSVLDIQVEGLLQRVAGDREQRCAALRGAADSQARQIVATARAEALANVRKAITQERVRIDQGMRQAEARAELEARRHEQQESQALLATMWADVAGVLETRWRDPAKRRAWMAAALAEAGALVSGRAWRIEQGAGWSDGERREAEELARQHGSGTVEWLPNTDIQAGLKIRAERVCIDATVAGLLVQHDEIESAFLAEYAAPASGSGEPPQ